MTGESCKLQLLRALPTAYRVMHAQYRPPRSHQEGGPYGSDAFAPMAAMVVGRLLAREAVVPPPPADACSRCR